MIQGNFHIHLQEAEMPGLKWVGVALILTSALSAIGEKAPKDWKIGRVLDESRARYFAGMLHNSSSQSTESGILNGNATNTSYRDTTDTGLNGTYSGTTHSTTSGTSIPGLSSLRQPCDRRGRCCLHHF